MKSDDPVFDGLNREQRDAVAAPSDCHYLILAGAGCGKTTVLTRRIACLAAGGIPLESILALTFTRKAADEMAVRVAALAKTQETSPALPAITTFHAFALKILSETMGDGTANFSRIGFSGVPRCCEEGERLRIFAGCSAPDERRVLGADVLRLDAMVERYHLFPEKTAEMPAEQAALLRTVSDRYAQCKRERGVWDFSDLVDGAVTLFEQYPSVADCYRRRFKAVLVDEFQDTNPLQVRFLHQLLSDGKYLFAVGDDDQAIYGFRGADIRPILEFQEHFPGARILKLQTNYRSMPALLAKANRIFREKDLLYRKVLVSGRYPRGSGTPPVTRRFDNQEKMAAWIPEQARMCAERLKVPIPSMAVLFRTNQSADRVAEYFRLTGAPDTHFPQLLTVHKSKGLEFPAVFLCDMEETVFPAYRKPSGKRIDSIFDLIRTIFSKVRHEDDPDLDEELRLFYVAVTRAQLHLYLLYSRTKRIYNRTRRFEPSRFLKYMR